MARHSKNPYRTVTQVTVASILLFAQTLAWAADSPAFAAPAASAGNSTPGVTRAVLSLALVLLLLFASAWALKRFAGMGGRANARLRTVASLSLGARERAVLIEVDGREVLLGVAPGNVRTLLVGDLPALQGEGDQSVPANAGTVASSTTDSASVVGAASNPPDLKATFSANLRRSLGR
jgi:flagellar protein FliO/FliZ